MKKILIIFSAIALFISCDENKETIESLSFPDDAFITFSKVADNVEENASDAIKIEALYANTSSVTEDVSIDFTISSENGTEGIDYTIVGGKSSFNFTPSSGKVTDYVEIMPVDNAILGVENIIINLTLGSSNYSTGYPGPNGIGKSTTVTIMDDDCAKEYALGIYAGDWSGTDSCGDYTDVPVKLQLPCGEGITIKGLGHDWLSDPNYWGEIVIFEYDVYISIDSDAGTIDIPNQTYVTTDYKGDVSDYNIIGTGTIDTSGTKPVMVVTYDITHGSYGSMANDYAGSSCSGLFESTITLQ
jgi:hypothetical protein